jgi:hypothetical protein
VTLRERIQLLRGEVAELEPQTHEEERTTAYVAALLEERRDALIALERGRRLGDTIEKTMILPGCVPERSGHQIVAEAENRLAGIAWKMRRLGAGA